MPYRAVVIGVSAGGLEALREVLSCLPADFPLPLLVVQHLGVDSDDFLARWLDQRCAIKVKEAEDKEPAAPGTAYLAPANYHLLMEDDGSLALSLEDWVNFSRPSIDLLFESAAEAYGKGLIAVVLTGANDDGSRGLAAMKRSGGLAVVQDPAGAEFPVMPRAAIQATQVDFVLPLPAIGRFLANLYRPA
ncbi:chemotaxis protein CheB [Desulfurivibrio dismutans]|uniref:chemotaxis protein CheB n=1 Tax=Desulfurivibrio dismutans TaxID=1398908 RepID=UPI0023DB8332|nr:chemotaxis protein CheB [Desulfurivibrio alkaliphilus]MDF1613584.1 chemotaxis protein CheB [Desulfurivibrio alkaliphilus]